MEPCIIYHDNCKHDYRIMNKFTIIYQFASKYCSNHTNHEDHLGLNFKQFYDTHFISFLSVCLSTLSGSDWGS